MSLQVSAYHSNINLGLTAWNSEEQAYYLVPFAQVSSFFKSASELINIPEGLVDNAFDFMASYDPVNEIVLITLNVDLLTVAVISKYEPSTKEAKAERLDWSLPKYIAFDYLQIHGPRTSIETYCNLFELTNEQYDLALGVVYND